MALSTVEWLFWAALFVGLAPLSARSLRSLPPERAVAVFSTRMFRGACALLATLLTLQFGNLVALTLLSGNIHPVQRWAGSYRADYLAFVLLLACAVPLVIDLLLDRWLPASSSEGGIPRRMVWQASLVLLFIGVNIGLAAHCAELEWHLLEALSRD